MGEVVFVLKTLAVTILIVFLMQIKVGDKTVEASTLSWLETSIAVDGLRYVAEGAVQLTSRTTSYIGETVSGLTGSKSAKANDGAKSEAYVRRQAKRRQKAEREAPIEGPTGDEID